MAAERKWALLRPDGSVAAQVIIAGAATPSEAGDNPDGLTEVRVKRFGDLRHEHWDTAKARWIGDPAKKARAERQFGHRQMAKEDLAEMLLGRIDALEARMKALEEKGA
jgi:hypothetical protein